MKEFLESIYKQCTLVDSDGSPELFEVLPVLFKQKKLDAVNTMMMDLDLTKVHTSTMYTFVFLVSYHTHELSYYKKFLSKIREEWARRGDTQAHIDSLLDKWEDGHPYKNTTYAEPKLTLDQRLALKIAEADKNGDSETVTLLTYYQSSLIRRDEKERKFRSLQRTIGDDKLREKTIQALKDMAKVLEEGTGSWPGIYYCEIPDDPIRKETFMASLEVTISYPWPG